MSKDIRYLVPKVGPKDAEVLLGSSEQWLNFGRRIQHHSAVQAFLLKKQNHRCPVCDCGLEGNLTIHHVSYINRCQYTATVDIPTPTPKRPDKTVQAPPCEGCPELARCAGFLALVHSACHVKIHALEAKQR
jgi:hypothetical protein